MSEVLPLSRPLAVEAIPGLGTDITVEATEPERDRLAKDFGLVTIDSLVGTYHVEKRGRTVHVTGRVRAQVVQSCVVSLDPFPATVDDPVDIKFVEDASRRFDQDDAGDEREVKLDAPDPIVGGRIDLGAITSEFLALALDPYPRKPGTDFAWGTGEGEAVEADPSPFAALAKLQPPGKA